MNGPNDREQDGKQTSESSEAGHAPTNHSFDETAIMSSDTGKPTSTPHPADSGATNWVGKSLGRYQASQVLGKGGMGVVLKARDPIIERDVAIKVLAEHLAADDAALSRFLAEAKAAGKVSHPNVVGILEAGQEGDACFLVMEFVPGGSLADQIEKQGALTLLEATRAMVDACNGIHAAHAAGLIHRDIKPANFMRAADMSVKVTDFGLAKATSSQRQITQAGTVIGTPFFMSPEQCQGMKVDARSDVYALGATYYSLLTGANPYSDSSSVPQVMYAHCHAEIPDPRKIDETIPAACSRIIAKAMAKSPDNRYQSVREMLADLESVKAALSGQTLMALPSESGSHAPMLQKAPPTAPPPNASKPAKALGRRAWVAMGGIALVAAALFLQPWAKRKPSPEEAGALSSTAEPITIGILHSLSGTMAESESVVVDAMIFAVDEINQSGGVLGRQLKAIVADGRSDPDIFASQAERLITEEQVSTVFGCWTSASRKSVKPIVEDHDHLLVYPLQYEGLETSPNVIYMGAAPNQQILPAIQWAFETLGKRRYCLVGSDYVFPRTANEIIKDELDRLGAEVLCEQYLPLGGTDVESAVEAIVQAKPDMILNTINGDSNIAFFRALRKAQILSSDCPVLSFSAGEAELRNLNPSEIAGDYAAWTYFQSIESQENERFVSRFREKYPQRIVTDPMESAYVGLMLWARAVNEVKELEPRRIRQAMLSQRFPSPGGQARLDPETQHCYKIPRIGQFQEEGGVEIIWTAPAPVRPSPFPSSRTATQWLAFLHDLHAGWGNRWSAP